ncbi:glutamine synthetase III [bacterium]|nr:glutamine synthetase III [bacterium]MBU1063626.1 glutamine synthetase III [bacterium]MBU1633253.1 glutamine synthetase III [bacterium]MBU1875418.1 glutamine synthetase III [bacterium]
MSEAVSLNSRKSAILSIARNGNIPKNESLTNSSSYFGVNSFNDKVMREKLPKEVYKKLRDTIRKGSKLDMSIADSVAHAMKEWAIEKGVTHFTHWFQPLTGLTAEKHDAFLEIDEGGIVVERFGANQLVQGEPDASSFPSGGRRSTFEARGYTMWDASSPAFIMDNPKGGILCIPSVFISYNGDALDKKTPLLRSMEAIKNSGLRILKLFGNDSATRVVTTIGTEQEYFLIDRSFFSLRPDLQITGRTLFGAQPPKGQQLEDHYFGSIKERVLAFMQDSETELYKLGIPAKTRHNEVAPHQYEIAPIYAEANIGADRNQLIMEVLKRVAYRNGLSLLLHEKPFAGINGSGKHNNWSLEDSDGNNLLDPGKTPEENLQFLVFLGAILRAVYKYGDLLRASVATAGNDHRLGANEAPPAIMSVFLGERLNNILDDIKEGKRIKAAEDFVIDLGLSNLPLIMRDNTDRNRTSPFAFTGSKFEFRAIGSSASVSLSNTVLNGAVAESLNLIADDIEQLSKKEPDFPVAVLKVLRKYIIETETIRFEGNNYDQAWEKEAVKRGLPNIKRSGYALDSLVAEKNKNMLINQKIFNEAEITSSYHTKLEQYVKTLEIEADTINNMIRTKIIPAAIAYQKQLLDTVNGLTNLKGQISEDILKTELAWLNEFNTTLNNVKTSNDTLMQNVKKGLSIKNLSEQAKYFADDIVGHIEKVRENVDLLENITSDDLWPLPKYSEMLFIL